MFIDSITLPDLPGLSLTAGNTEFPVTGIDISGAIDGDGVMWTVTADFENPLESPVEASFTLPLPNAGAVIGMTMKVGERIIEADIKEREAARVEYEEAKEQGFTAALFEQDRAEIFTISVGNIHPGEEISIAIQIHDRVAIEGTEASLRMPTMIKQRYIPEDVPDRDAINPPRVTGQTPLLGKVSINFAQDATDIICETIPQAVITPQNVTIADFALTSDIVVRWTIPVAIAHAKWVADADNPEMGTLEVNIRVPEKAPSIRRRKAVQVMFDRSGSMDGHYLQWARRMVDDLIASLTDEDLIHVLTFDSSVEVLGVTEHGFVPATRTTKNELQRQLAQVTARGGTELTEALKTGGAALAMLDDHANSEDIDRVAVLISDGAYGDEASAVFHRDNSFQGARVISVAIGENANGFLEILSANGVCVYVSSESGLAVASNKVMSRVATAAYSQASLKATGLTHQAPSFAPDIYPNVVVNMSGRMPRPKAGDTVEIVAAGGEVISLPINASSDSSATTRWANQRIKSLDYQIMSSNFTDLGIESHDALTAEIIALSVKYKVLSKYTAWLAVDRSRSTDQVIVRKLIQPVYENFDAEYLLVNRSVHASAVPNIDQMVFSFDATMPARTSKLQLSYEQEMILMAIRHLVQELLASLENNSVRDDFWSELENTITEWLTNGNPDSLGKQLSKKLEHRMIKLQNAQEAGIRAKKKLANDLLSIIAEMTISDNPFEWEENF